jgi:hypothetical protein
MQVDQVPPSAVDAPTAGKPRREASWVSWVLLTIVVLFGLAVVIPNFVRVRVTVVPNACVNNLRQINGAKQQWALDNGKAGGDVPTWSDIAPYLGRTGISVTNLRCPDAGVRVVVTNAALPQAPPGVPYSFVPAGALLDSYEIGAVSNPPKCKIKPKSHVLRVKR